MDIDWKDREALLAIYKERTQEMAAHSLGVTQASLSLRLKKVQEKLKIQLFEEKGRSKSLSPQIIKLIKFWDGQQREFFKKEDEIYSEIDEAQNYLLKIAGRNEILDQYSRQLINFSSSIELLSMDSRSAKQELLDGTIDACILKNKINSFECMSKELGSGTFVLAIPKNYKKINMNNKKGLSALSDKSFLSFKERIEEIRLLEKQEFFGFSLAKPKLIFDNWNSILNLVEEGKGWTVCPQSFTNKRKIEIYNIPDIGINYKFYFNYAKRLKQLKWFREDLSKL